MSIERECGTKVRYHTRGAAFDTVMHLIGEDGWANRYVYHCKHCGYYHFGHGTFAKLPDRVRSNRRRLPKE